MKKILIVEDDKKLNNGIHLALRNDYYCSQVYSLMSAREFDVKQFDLILLDVNFPDGSGMDYLMEIRRKSNVPVILLTANNMEIDIVSGLEQGADDYITKPFSLMVLRARVNVQLRDSRQDTGIFKDGDYYFDFYKMEFLYKGSPVYLSRTEQRILLCLIENRGKSVSMAREIFLIENIILGIVSVIAAGFFSYPVLRYLYKISDMEVFGHKFSYNYTAFITISAATIVLCIMLSVNIIKSWKTRQITSAMVKAD